MRIAAVIIAGGRSTRMGQQKAFMIVGGKSLADRIVKRAVPQVTTIAINGNDDTAFSHFQLTIIPDIRKEIQTPLAGLHASLLWARDEGFDALLSVPSDCPFLPLDLVARLGEANALAAIASSGGESHFLTGLWSHTLAERLDRAIESEKLYRVKDWVAYCGATTVTWEIEPYDPFFNVNTPEDLAEANRIAAEFDL